MIGDGARRHRSGVVGNTIRERHHHVERISAEMGRAANVLYHVEGWQQACEATSVRVVVVLSLQVEIPTDHHGTRVHDHHLKQIRQLLEKQRRWLL